MTSMAEAIRSWFRWRAGKRSTVLGWLAFFGAQAVAGLVLFLGLMAALGAPMGMPVFYCAFFFAVGCGLSGVIFGLVWSALFLQIAGLGFGLSIGIWFGSPSWWASAAAEWRAGTTIPKLVIVAGLLLPPIWCASCALMHKVWFKGWEMGIGKVLAFFGGGSKDDSRRKEAVKKLDVSDLEAERALRQSGNEPEGLAVIGKSKVVRSEESLEPEEEETAEDAYASLAVGGEAEELSGLDRAAAKSKQKVDASGAVVDDDGEEAEEPKPTPAPEASAPAAEPTPAAVSAPVEDMLRGEDRNRLQFLAEEYNLGMSTASDENEALLDFMEKHTSALLGMSDRDIAFLRALPDDFGKGLAQAALEIQAGISGTDTSFKDAVDKGLEELDASSLQRPTASVPQEDDDLIPLEEEAQDANEEQGFSADFSFSGDQASREMSGRRVASLLSQAASMEQEPAGFPQRSKEEPARASLDSIVIEDEPEDGGEATSTEAGAPVSVQDFDPVMRRMELIGEGMSSLEAKAQVEKELKAIEEAEKAGEADVPVAEDSPETVNEEIASPDGIDAPSEDETMESESSSEESIEGEADYGGFTVDVKEDAEEESALASDDASQSAVSDEDTSNSEDNGEDSLPAGEAANDRNGEEMVEAVVSEIQAHRIYSCMNDHGKSPREKFDMLMQIEREEGAINTITAVRSNVFSELFSEKVALEIRNAALALIRDFKDEAIMRFGETAAEAEAKVEELKRAPHKIERSRLDALDKLISEMEENLRDDQPTQQATDRKIRLTSIKAEVRALEDMLIAQSTPRRRVKSAPPSDGQRAMAKSMVESLGGEERITVRAPEPAPEVEEESDEIDLESAAAEQDGDDPVVTNEFADKPWLDPELGNLDEEYQIIPEGLDINTDEGAETMRQRADIHARRVKAKKLRDAAEAEERSKREEAEREEQERIAKSVKLADLTQREEALRDSEADLSRRSMELESQKAQIERDRAAIKEESRKVGERGKVFDELSQVFGEDVGKKVEAVQFLHHNMQGFFEIRKVPPRFAQVESLFMDLALSKAIQKRVKGSSVSLQEVFGRENGDDLPERLFPHKSIVTFHGATIFRKAAEIIHKLAVEMEVEVEVPSTEEGQANADQLVAKCASDMERDFVQEVIVWLNASQSEYFQLHHAVEENAEDYREARRAESSDVHDVEVLSQANATMKRELEERNEELSEARAEIKRLEEQAKRRPSAASGSSDDSGTAEEAMKMFANEGFTKSRGKASFEVGGRRVVVGIFDSSSEGPERSKVIDEMNANRTTPFVIFTNVPVDKRQDFEEILPLVSTAFEPLDLEKVGSFIEEEVRKLNDD